MSTGSLIDRTEPHFSARKAVHGDTRATHLHSISRLCFAIDLYSADLAEAGT